MFVEFSNRADEISSGEVLVLKTKFPKIFFF